MHAKKKNGQEVNVNPKLVLDKIERSKESERNFKEILTDIPGCTNLEKHEIQLTGCHPVTCAPYALPHGIKSEVERDIQNMLQMGILSQIISPYAFRLVNYRKTNDTLRN